MVRVDPSYPSMEPPRPHEEDAIFPAHAALPSAPSEPTGKSPLAPQDMAAALLALFRSARSQDRHQK